MPDLRFTFLGTGTSAGVPALGCSCAVCTSPDPRDRRLRTSGIIEFVDAAGHDRTILIDCGPDFRAQALNAAVKRLDAVWRLRKVDDASTDLALELLIVPDLSIPAPRSLVLSETQRAAARAVSGARTEAERRARR